MTNITIRQVSTEKEELLNTEVKKWNALPSKITKFPIREDTQDLQSFAGNVVAWRLHLPVGDRAF